MVQFNIKLSEVPNAVFAEEPARALAPEAPTGFVACDVSDQLGCPFEATTPLILARYARINTHDQLIDEARATGAPSGAEYEVGTSWSPFEFLGLVAAAAAVFYAIRRGAVGSFIPFFIRAFSTMRRATSSATSFVARLLSDASRKIPSSRSGMRATSARTLSSEPAPRYSLATLMMPPALIT